MPDHTTQFRALVHENAVPKLNTKKPSSPDIKKKKITYDVYTKEAYRIYEHVTSLKRFLLTIRRPYLNSDPHRRTSLQSKSSLSSPSQKQKQKEGSLFSLFPSHIQSLNDKERDEIDFQAKVIIRRCMDRIKELEQAEQLRQQQQEKQQHSLSQFFQSLISPSSMTAQDTLTLHRSSMTWLLNKRLAQVSELQKNQQEIRLTRELEKSENQLYKASSTTSKAADPVYKFEDYGQEEDEDDSQAFQVDELSQEQMQMLEKENSVMIEELNNTLNQVRNAEKALLEISTLQNELTSHLAAQTAQTDRLYADAIASTERVEQGNVQLIQTRERNRGTRHFTLFFLLMASFVLLFLDWYA
ncbi:hypothetical protein BDA99DRAFT_524482 [Phascolomyces articulosus]|uniref:SNARE-complex protein Syntaxin-18 N-terminal domain-containing protein n=1 Tax=Phascolomyces articulosus TaxID=60185 RepID=A0AAD5JZV4_9FUNG|nr:hypothetical protein BDA99DRAFT_524482 [Phascolomyces articulosus]